MIADLELIPEWIEHCVDIRISNEKYRQQARYMIERRAELLKETGYLVFNASPGYPRYLIPIDFEMFKQGYRGARMI